MKLWDAMQKYLDPLYGLAMPPDGGKDNLILDSAFLHRELLIHQDHAAADELSGRASAFLGKCEIRPGLYLRYPGNLEDNSPDNLIGSAWFEGIRAQNIYQRWVDFYGCFDVKNPDLVNLLSPQCYVRIHGLETYLAMAAKKAPTPLQLETWNAVSTLNVLVNNGPGNELMQSLQNDKMAMNGHGRTTLAAWEIRYKVADLYAQQFGEDYPLTKARRGKL